MDQSEYMHFITHCSPNHPTHEPESRIYKNSQGVDTVITLTRGYWRYVDWLEARVEIHFAWWVIDCDRNPVEDRTLSDQLMCQLWLDECDRFRKGFPTPNSFPSMGYEGWADEYHAKPETL